MSILNYRAFVENITNVVEEKGDYYLELSLQDQDGNLVTKAKQFLRIN